MRYITRPLTVFIALMMIGMIFPRNAYAYLDPGTGSYFLQLLLAAALGALFTLRIFWRRIMSYLKGIFSGAGKDDKTTGK